MGIRYFYDEENEGSPKFIKRAADRYSERSEYQVLTITPDDLQAIAEDEQMNEWF